MAEDSLLRRALMPLSRPYRGFSEPTLLTVTVVAPLSVYLAGGYWFGWDPWETAIANPVSEWLPVLLCAILVGVLVSAPALLEWQRQLREDIPEEATHLE